jgi:hypothetical protein
MLIAFSAISGVLIFIGVLTSIGARPVNQQSFIVLSYISLFLGGFIITSTAFSELHKPEKSSHYITLPASGFEKVFTSWLSTSVIFVLVAVSFFYAAWYVTSVLAFFLTNTPMATINFIDAELWKIIGIYFAVQPVFFLGAIYFKGYNFLKTLLALFVISFAHSIFQTLFSLIVFGEMVFNNSFDNANWNGSGGFFLDLLGVLKIFGLYILPPFLLIVSYIRFNEREG